MALSLLALLLLPGEVDARGGRRKVSNYHAEYQAAAKPYSGVPLDGKLPFVPLYRYPVKRYLVGKRAQVRPATCEFVWYTNYVQGVGWILTLTFVWLFHLSYTFPLPILPYSQKHVAEGTFSTALPHGWDEILFHFRFPLPSVQTAMPNSVFISNSVRYWCRM